MKPARDAGWNSSTNAVEMKGSAMTRSDFVKCCTAGMCSCAAAALPAAVQAEPGNAEVEQLQWKVDFAQKRFAKLVQIVNESLDEPAQRKVWESLGRDHGREYRGLAEKYKGNIPGFLEHISGQWVEKAEYDAAAGRIRIVDKSKTCTCPLVKLNVTPPAFCNCTLGWQKEVYSIVAGRPVEATLEESVLRGGTRCVFRISIL